MCSLGTLLAYSTWFRWSAATLTLRLPLPCQRKSTSTQKICSFNLNNYIGIYGYRLQLWPGLITAVDEYEGGLMLCCDLSFRVLRTTTVLDELQVLNVCLIDIHIVSLICHRVEMKKKGSAFEKTALDLVGLSVLTGYNNTLYRIDDILFNKNPMSTFIYHGSPITYADYYKKNYNKEIKDKDQPLLLTRYPGNGFGFEFTKF